jgi:hypothetical protein
MPVNHIENYYNLPPFPVTALPKAITDMCSAVSKSMEVPLEMPSTVALGVLATCSQSKNIVRIGADYFEPLNLFTLAIADSGERKSPVFRILTEPVYTAQKDYIAIHEDEIENSEIDYSLLEEQLKEAKRSKGDKPADSVRVRSLYAELRKFKRFVAPKLLVDDITSEKLIAVLDEQGGSVTIASAESGLFIDLRNKAATSGSFDVYLKAYSGDSVDVKRIGRKGNSIENPRLSLILTCQTDVAASMVNNKTFRDKGLPARFLYALCRSNLGFRVVDTADIPVAVKAEYNTLIRRLLDYTLDKESPSYEIPLTDDGRVAYHEYGKANEPRLRNNGDYAHMRDWFGKVVGQMLRISGIIAVCEGRAKIDADIIRRASALAEWYAANAVALFTKTKPNSRVRESDTEYLLNILKKWDSDKEKTIRDVRRITIGRQNFDFDSTLEELQTQGHIKIIKKQGSKSRIVELNL